MKFKRFTFKFKDGNITVYALHREVAVILAQAHAIERGWDYTIL
jgi:hypothetical protein